MLYLSLIRNSLIKSKKGKNSKIKILSTFNKIDELYSFVIIKQKTKRKQIHHYHQEKFYFYNFNIEKKLNI